ncbi:MAG: radical SAM/SPASM domain-containing protein [Acidobacteria bacterium RIFCSPLOWO2_02_FULL_61_28]|nr:MAG: radical SAM/SPASM domain-containing protein [Acidobacteria bacterium RIFCSPLOWO2_02_FULL_61_28]
MPDVAYRPRLVFWELTRGCNLRCIHCRASATELSSPDDLNYEESVRIVDQLAAYAPMILVLSGGEPLFRRDVFQLARRATSLGIRVALGTNGTMITADIARQISEAGIRRVAISLDGPDAATHDAFRGIPGAFEKAVEGFEHLKRLGMSVQINTSVAKHNAAKLPETLDLALRLGADAFHLFLLVPVGCGVQIADKQMVEAEEYEQILNWLYDRTLENRIELKATCAPHFFRVVRQRRAESRQRGEALPELPAHGHGGHAPSAMNMMTRGCLAGTGVCFISHKGEVYPCGYLPLEAGSLHRQSFTEVWETSPLFASLRDLGNLKGKCGICEFRNICEGCRARAFGCTGDYLAEEPFCLYTPRGQQPPVSVSAPQLPLVSLQAHSS